MLVVGAGGGGLALLLLIAIAIGVILCLMLKRACKTCQTYMTVQTAVNPT